MVTTETGRDIPVAPVESPAVSEHPSQSYAHQPYDQQSLLELNSPIHPILEHSLDLPIPTRESVGDRWNRNGGQTTFLSGTTMRVQIGAPGGKLSL